MPPACASASVTRTVFDSRVLPPTVAAALWHGDQLGSPAQTVHPSGFEALDAALPGGGWPGHSLTEILSPQSATLEWRLLGPALARAGNAGRSVVLVGPPRQPHLPGLRLAGLNERHLVWIQAETPAERLWSAEQLVKGQAAGALVVWLPQVRPEQVRRLQVLAADHVGPVFVCRPSTAAQESSAAPLRLLARLGLDWTLQVDVFKRQGPPLFEPLRLPAVPAGLQTILTPRLRQPGALRAGDRPGRHLPQPGPNHTMACQPTKTDHALVSTSSAPPQRRVTTH